MKLNLNYMGCLHRDLCCHLFYTKLPSCGPVWRNYMVSPTARKELAGQGSSGLQQTRWLALGGG